MKLTYAHLIVSTFALFLLSGCFDSAVKKAAEDIDRQAYMLQQEKGDISATYKQSIADLQKASQTELANEVQNVLDRSVDGAAEKTSFELDFVRNRSAQTLRKVADVLRGGKKELISSPEIGDWTPKKIDLYLPAERRTSLEFSGYDLNNKTSDGKGLRIVLLLSDGSSSDVSEHLYKTTFYHAVVNTSGSGLQFPQNSKELRLLWGDTLLSQIPVLLPKFSWHRSDNAGTAYSKTFSFISENEAGVDGGKIASGQFTLGIPDARIYRIDFRHEGDGAPWNYHPTNAPPNEYQGCTELLDGGKSFKWTRRWAGKPTTEYYTAFYEIWQTD